MPPKRKAASKLSKLIDDDVDVDELIDPQLDVPEDPDTAAPPAKRARGGRKAAAAATSVPATTTTRQTARQRRSPVAKPKKQPTKRAAKATRAAVEEEAEGHEGSEVEYSGEYNGVGESQTASEDELDSPKTVTKPSKAQTRSGRLAQKETETAAHVLTDGEFEYTPGSKKGRQQTKARRGGRKVGRQPQLPPEPEEDGASVPEVDETAAGIEETVLHQVQSSPLKGALAKSPYRRSTTQGNRRKSVRIEEPGESEATLRRKLGDTTKKLENAEARYRNLREVGIVEANANMDKLRKQCEATTAASKELVASLKKELEMQTNLAKQSRNLQKQLKERNTKVSELESKLDDMSSTLSNAQSEIKALQTKLTAARNAAANVENTQSKPGRGPAARSNGAGGPDSHAVQTAQLKEDLYSDLTGLIIRDAKKKGEEDVYDCIQTGLNGTLHFKLTISDPEHKGFDAAEFQYTPLLDSNRDRDLIDILPDYLAVDITFSRQNAAKFYSRVVDTLTKKRAS